MKIQVNVVLLAVLVISLLVFTNSMFAPMQISSTNLVNLSCNMPDHFLLVLTEYSVWTWLMLLIFMSGVGLWIYSNYLEFDTNYVSFTLKLVLFLFAVWVTINGRAMLLVLLTWEIIGFISFSLINSWSSRNYTVSSAFSAVGFNRIGDVLFVYVCVILINVTTNTALLWLFIFALVFKSVNFLTYLWLPEAMEGPTPVSSLLHSCTLVMAGIFTLYNVNIKPTSGIVAMFIFSLTMICLLARPEKDTKRIIATSTVLMVGLIWTVLSYSLSSTAVLICAIHAAYKSALFLTTGKLLSNTSTYTDNVNMTAHVKSFLPLICLFLVALKTGTYNSCKHMLDAICFEHTTDQVFLVVLACGGLIYWVLGLKIFNTNKNISASNINDLFILILVSSVYCFHSWIVSSAGITHSNLIFIFSAILLRLFSRIYLNVGSIALSTSLHNYFLIKYQFIKFMLAFCHFNLSTPLAILLTGCLLTMIAAYYLYNWN